MWQFSLPFSIIIIYPGIAHEIPTHLYTCTSRQKKVPLSGGASPYGPLPNLSHIYVCIKWLLLDSKDLVPTVNICSWAQLIWGPWKVTGSFYLECASFLSACFIWVNRTVSPLLTAWFGCPAVTFTWIRPEIQSSVGQRAKAYIKNMRYHFINKQ